MRGFFIAVMAIGFATAALGAGTIYRCVGAEGEAYFTDRPCTAGEVRTVDPADVMTIPALDAHEAARAQRVYAEQTASERAIVKQRSVQQRAEARDAAARDRNCAAARAGLDRVHQIKRRGYSVASSADLHARERKYALLAEHNCS